MKSLRKTRGEKPRLIQRTAAKVTAFFLAILMTAVCIASIIVALGGMIQTGMYSKPEDEFIRENIEGIVYDDSATIIDVVVGNWEILDIDEFCNSKNIAKVEIERGKVRNPIWTWKRDGKHKTVNKYHRYFEWNKKLNQRTDTSIYPFLNPERNSENIKVTIYYLNPPVIGDNYKQLYDIIHLGYSMRYAIYVVIFLSFFLSVASFVFLMCASGHHKGREEVEKGWGTGFPLDLLVAVVFVPLILLLSPYWNYYGGTTPSIIPLLVGLFVWEIPFTAFCMSFALRVKLGKWWQNTVIYKLLRGVVRLIRSVPLVWRTALIISGVFFVELILMVANWSEPFDVMLTVWFTTKLVLFVAVIFVAIQLRKLKKGGEAIANGDTDYKIDSSKMLLPDFKTHAENLNNISCSVNIAVGEKIKSERMKTELITNVSHDIKTPLTSIINYADLIGKEECDNEKITEYSEVLLRQSERLKRLIEDLVEASKASTGNLEVVLAPIDANILLTQAVGEYEEKIRAANLEIITNEPAEAISINADGRRLWRVFDNLLNNICKYAQSGTRVYLSLERDGKDAVITFKNTSRTPLNISADELMERFVRGDESRSTEGNGLGLSIAKSLTELQNGTLSIFIDGDLFKVVVRFPLV